MAAGLNPSFPPRSRVLQQTSTSSPACRNCGSNPLMTSSQLLRKAMLQPGMCSASQSETSTWAGPPGELAMQFAVSPSSGTGIFGPPTPAYSSLRNAAARYVNQSGSGLASSSIYATISPVADCHPKFRAALRPWFSVRIKRTSYSAAISPAPSVEPSSTTMVS